MQRGAADAEQGCSLRDIAIGARQNPAQGRALRFRKVGTAVVTFFLQNIRSGQTYYLHLQLGQPTEAVLVPRGTFYQTTGGAWIYVLSPEGDRAYKRPIRIGRQNPQYYEVLEGLQPGERVIVSGYESYGANDVLLLNRRIK